MKIGLDCRMYRSSVAGIGRYSQNLVKNLLEIDSKNEYLFFMTKEDVEEFRRKAQGARSKFKIVQTDITHFSLSEQTKLGKIIEAEKLDLMHFLNFNHPVNYRGKFITTIHDLTLLLFPGTAKKSSLIKRTAFKYVMNKAGQNSQKIIVDANNTAKDLREKFHVAESKITTIYLAADDKELRIKNDELRIKELKNKYQIKDQPIILTVGQFRPHKNLPSLVEAFYLVKKDLDAKLVILGKPDPKHTRLQESIDKSEDKRDIIMPGFITDEELATWYKLATVYVFPSLYEGFGLPGLEAMQAGTPVVASRASALPEVYEDAAIYFNPLEIQEIADKIKEVIENPKLRADLIARGKKQAAKYSWRKTALDTLKVYQEVHKAKSP